MDGIFSRTGILRVATLEIFAPLVVYPTEVLYFFYSLMRQLGLDRKLKELRLNGPQMPDTGLATGHHTHSIHTILHQ